MDALGCSLLGQSGFAHFSLSFNNVDLHGLVGAPAPSVLRVGNRHILDVVMRRAPASQAVWLVDTWIDAHSQQSCSPCLAKVVVVALQHRCKRAAT